MHIFLEEHKNNHGYPVPEGYFEQLPEQVLQQIAEQDAIEAVLAQHKSTSLPIPPNYFEQLPEVVLHRIAQESAKIDIPDTFSEIQQPESDYPVPTDYFTRLPDQVMVRIEAAEASRYVLRRRFTRIAGAAATVAIFVGVAFFFAQNIKETETIVNPHSIAVAKNANKSEQQTQTETKIVHVRQLTAQNEVPSNNTGTKRPTKADKSSATTAVSNTDPTTDKFIAERLETEEMDVMDYDILDFYSEDMATADMWGW